MTTFFFLYMSEGLPFGFTSIALAAEMRTQGVSPTNIGLFTASLSLPWTWKWIMGPFVDVFSSDRYGRRRTWILVAQVLMIATLLTAVPIDFTANLKLLIGVMIIHNIFAATQDVAIDALACGILHENERGMGNGFMFAGAWLGSGLGGSGALYLLDYTSLPSTFFVIASSILLISFLVVLPMREPKSKPASDGQMSRWQHFIGGLKDRVVTVSILFISFLVVLPKPASRINQFFGELQEYVSSVAKAISSSRAAMAGFVFGLFPTGAYALSSTLQSTLSVELLVDRKAVADLNMASTIVTALGCVAGGLMSDRFGRRKMLAIYVLVTAIPTLWFASVMSNHGWVHPISIDAADRPVPSPALLQSFWIAILVFGVFHGLLTGTRVALFMDLCTPEVATTQFTAYMSMLGLGITYSAAWQGYAIDQWGYPTTLKIDAGLGLVCLLLLPLMAKRKPGPATL